MKKEAGQKQKGKVMATSIECKCKCGKRHHIYVPYARGIKQLSDTKEVDMEKAKEWDKEEIARGDLKAVKVLAAMYKATFIDGSVIEAYQCECGAVIDLDNVIQKYMSNDVPSDK